MKGGGAFSTSFSLFVKGKFFMKNDGWNGS
nr:MAG TPA: hypothetical protein [Caudoviricetes sp.]